MEQVPQQAVAPKKKKKGWMIALIIGAVVIIGGGVALAMFFISSLSGPANVAKTFLSDLNGNKLHQAYDSTADLFKSATTEQQFNTFVGQYPIFSNLASFAVDSVATQTTNGQGVAKADMTLKAKDGSSQQVVLTLVNEKGKWKVATLEFAPSASKTTTPTKAKK